MFAEQTEINCPGFQKQEPTIKDITNKINRAEGILAKVRFAEELLKKVNAFIFCPDYDGNKAECKHCRSVAILRKKTAEIIVKAEKLV